MAGCAIEVVLKPGRELKFFEGAVELLIKIQDDERVPYDVRMEIFKEFAELYDKYEIPRAL